MSKFIILLLGLLALNGFCQTLKNNPFKKVIVLVMENHTFDNILGYMDAPIGTLQDNTYCNEVDGKKYCTRAGANYKTEPDPGHHFMDTQQELYNDGKTYPVGSEYPPNLGGFAANYAEHNGDPQNVLDCFTPEQVPVISKLVETFYTYTNWFSAVPSQTNPNKVFVHAATSSGNLDNCAYWYCGGWPFQHDTIQTNLMKEGHSWSIHWMDWCEAMAITPMNTYRENYVYDQNFVEFFEKLESGTLDDYTYLIPRIHWDEVPEGQNKTVEYAPNTQHPSEDIRAGELLIKQVYENFRKSSHWEDTLLLITYDEHGGFYDHVIPPMNVTNPSPDQTSSPYAFDFTRLGLRVPAVSISPWLKQNVDDLIYEHSSIPRTIKEIFDLKTDYLTARDAEALSFIRDDMILDKPRTDCPMTLPDVPSFEDHPLQMSEVDMNGSPESQLYLLGTMLINEGYASLEKLKPIVEGIKTDAQAGIFSREASAILGFRPMHTIREFKFLQQEVLLKRYQENIEVVEI